MGLDKYSSCKITDKGRSNVDMPISIQLIALNYRLTDYRLSLNAIVYAVSFEDEVD